MQLALPSQRLLEMMSSNGPLPVRHQRFLARQLYSGSPVLEYSAHELLAMRNWWRSRRGHSGSAEQRSRVECMEGIRMTLSNAGMCSACAADVAGMSTCARCGESVA
jgi:hypothetical protein